MDRWTCWPSSLGCQGDLFPASEFQAVFPPQRPDRVTNCPRLPGTEFSQDVGFFCAKSGRLGHCTPGPPGHSVRAFNILLGDIVGIWIGTEGAGVPASSVRPEAEDAPLYCSAPYFAFNLYC